MRKIQASRSYHDQNIKLLIIGLSQAAIPKFNSLTQTFTPGSLNFPSSSVMSHKVMHVISGLGRGGAEATLFRLLSNWTDSSITHYLVSLTDNNIYDFSFLGNRFKVFDLHSPIRAIPNLIKLHLYIFSIRPSLINTWMYHPCLLALSSSLLRVPTVWSIHHSLHYFSRETIILRLVIYSCRFLAALGSVRRIVYVSDTSRLQHERFGFPKKKSALIPNGFDSTIFKPRYTQPNILPLPLKNSRSIVFGSFARYHPIKNHILLFECISRLLRDHHDVFLVLAGEGMTPHNSVLVSDLRHYSIADVTVLLGPRSDVELIYPCLDIYMQTSDSEAFPNTLCEAMLCEVVCIATDVGDSSVIIHDFGLVVPPGDSEALYKAASRLVSTNRSELSIIGRESRRFIDSRFSIRIMLEAYQKLYHDSFLHTFVL